MKINILIIILIVVIIIIYLDVLPLLIGNNILNNYPIIRIKNNKKYLYFYSNLLSHYGDIIFNIYYFNLITNYIENNNIYIIYNVNNSQHDLINKMCKTNNLILKDYNLDGIHLLNNNSYYKNNWDYMMQNYNIKYFDILLKNFYNEVSISYGINYKINEFLNNDDTYPAQYDDLINKYGDKYKNIDILFINSIPQSNQYNYDKIQWDKFIINFNNLGFKIVTTLKLDNINCTRDDNLFLNDIGVLSSKCKIIIGINTGPLIPCLNKHTLDYVKNIYVFDRSRFSYDKIINCDNNNINIIDINKIINDIHSFNNI